MPSRIIQPIELTRAIIEATRTLDVGSVTGPGRSGAIASAIASHILGVPFIPFGAKVPTHLGRLLIIDTARATGATLRRAERKYADADPLVIACFEEPPRVEFWYERKFITPPKGDNA